MYKEWKRARLMLFWDKKHFQGLGFMLNTWPMQAGKPYTMFVIEVKFLWFGGWFAFDEKEQLRPERNLSINEMLAEMEENRIATRKMNAWARWLMLGSLILVCLTKLIILYLFFA